MAHCASSESANIRYLKHVTINHTGKRGHPQKVIDYAYLQEVMSPTQHITLTKLAEILRIHRHTLQTHLKAYGVDYQFTVLSDHDLNILVKVFRSANPESGICYLVSFLRTHGLCLQKRRVAGLIHHVDHLGHQL